MLRRHLVIQELRELLVLPVLQELLVYRRDAGDIPEIQPIER